MKIIKLGRNVLEILRVKNKLVIGGIVFAWIAVLASANYAQHQNLVRSQLRDDIGQYEDHLRLLNSQVSQLQSISRIEDESMRLELVKIDPQNIFYIDAADNQVALK